MHFRTLKIIATSGLLTALECIEFAFDWGCAPDPGGGAYSAPSDPLAGLIGVRGKGEWKKGSDGEGIVLTPSICIFCVRHWPVRYQVEACTLQPALETWHGCPSTDGWTKLREESSCRRVKEYSDVTAIMSAENA